MCASVSIFLCQSKVDDVDKVALLAEAHQKVVRFDISVDEIFRMNELNSADLEYTHTKISLQKKLTRINTIHIVN